MSHQFPQVAVVAVLDAEGLPLFTRAYVSIEVKQRKSHPSCPVPCTAVAHNKARAVWNETQKILLLPGSAVDVVFTVWNRTEYNCDIVLGRGTHSFPRMHPRTEVTVGLGGQRRLRVALVTETVPVLSARAVVAGGELPSNDSIGDGWHQDDLVFDESKVHWLLSRSAINWLATKLDATKKRMAEVQATHDEAVAVAAAATERLESLKRAVALGKEIDTIKSEERRTRQQQCEDEMNAALQALEGAEKDCDRERKLRIIAERDAGQLRLTASKFKAQLDVALARNAEAAAVEALVAGGSHQVIAALEEKMQRLTYENKLLRVKTVQYDEMVELIHSLNAENHTLKDYQRRKAKRIAASIKSTNAGCVTPTALVPAQPPDTAPAKTRPVPTPSTQLERDNVYIDNVVAGVRGALEVHTAVIGRHPLPPARVKPNRI
eukprot:TRINITY_DN30366_c0_g1_i1.p1 TRINITY_DN30366_c0_g1~~TRINITY_DN30366_c0_g1_i1.p1  ORF type:complete len:435 (+),score=158.46 TRINITY_DN30366_c0_g1_i1:163-1467(+)